MVEQSVSAGDTGGLDPYAHWFTEQEEPRFEDDLDFLDFRDFPTNFVGGGGWLAKKLAEILYNGGGGVPLPKGAAYDPTKFDPSTWTEDAVLLESLEQSAKTVHQNTVLTAVIDTGVALANETVLAGGDKSRVLVSWQQSAVRGGQSQGKQNYLPFGEELYQTDIDGLLRKHSHGNWLDEDAFNREAQLVTLDKPAAQRDLAHQSAHGTHVMDLAAGEDPSAVDPYDLARRPLMVVNLPDRLCHGSAGNFLQYFVAFGVARIVDLAIKLWKLASEAQDWDTKQKGFPLVINLSFGMQAGPKDGTLPLEVLCETLISEYRKKAPAVLVVPAGNDNLARCHMRQILGEKGKKGSHPHEAEPAMEIPWRVQPQDQSSNFLEIWTTEYERSAEGFGPPGVTLDITGPDGLAWMVNVAGMRSKSGGRNPARHMVYWKKLTDGAYLYAEEVFPNPKVDTRARLRVVLALAPSLLWDFGTKTWPTAAAGLWMVKLHYDGEPVDVSAYVQSDQALRSDMTTALRSYFDHPNYGRIQDGSWDYQPGDAKSPLTTGAQEDTYGYPEGEHFDNWNRSGPVQRKGTLNALATAGGIVTIGAFDARNGRPLAFSSSAQREDAQNSTQDITALFPADDGPAHRGLLATGSRSGSAALYRGTSMSAALATRTIVERILDWWPPKDLNTWLKGIADGQEQLPLPDNWYSLENISPVKRGGGRVRTTTHSNRPPR